MKFSRIKFSLVLFLGLSLLTSFIAQAQTGAPPDAGQGGRACVNVFVPGVIIEGLEALPIAPDDVPLLDANGVIVRILPEASEENVVPLLRFEFDMDANDNRGVVCFFFEFQDFALENEDASRIIRIEEVILENEETECVLPEDLLIPNVSFSLDIYDDFGDGELITEENLITDFSGESDEEGVEEPILLVTNIPNPPPFDIQLRYCDESPEDDPETADVDESSLEPEFAEIPSLQEYCDDAETALIEAQAAGEASEDAELPDICDELIRLPQNRAVFVITETDGYFNYAVDRP